MSEGAWVAVFGMGLTFIVGILNYWYSSRRGRSMGGLEESQTIKALNESIRIAADNALEDAKDKAAAEVTHKKEIAALREEFRIDFEEIRTENVSLKTIVLDLQAQIASIVFEIKLVGQMGSDPRIKTVTIKRVPAEKK
jgi:hypothetical protein